jgi:WhiB family redox-sensing transcriptional regulator
MPRRIGPPVAAFPYFIRDGRGHCRHVDPELFTEIGDRGEKRRKRVEDAKQVCAGCPFRVACAQWALDTNQLGVWGGTSDQDRQALRRKAAGGYQRKLAA